MKRISFAALALFLFNRLAFAGGGLDNFHKSLNIQAQADINGFSAKVSAQFGVPTGKTK